MPWTIFYQNWEPPSLIISLGVPNLEKMLFFRNAVILLHTLFESTIDFTYFDTSQSQQDYNSSNVNPQMYPWSQDPKHQITQSPISDSYVDLDSFKFLLLNIHSWILNESYSQKTFIQRGILQLRTNTYSQFHIMKFYRQLYLMHYNMRKTIHINHFLLKHNFS